MHFETFGEAYQYALGNIMMNGANYAPRGMMTKECLGVSFTVKSAQQNVLVHPVRNLNYRFMVAEWLWIASGRKDVAGLARYNGEMARFSDDGLTLAGAYGPRILGQLPWILQKLCGETDTRQAVCQIWSLVPKPSKDIPCTLSLQWLLRRDDLHCVVNMRSSDAWLGLPYDFFTFSMLTNLLASTINAKVGSITMCLGSSHLYEPHFDLAWKMMQKVEDTKTIYSSQLEGRWEPGRDYLTHCPWPLYRDVLETKNRKEALECLEQL